ncbi:MAG TPA: EthD family reductase [Candidatus Deferrimicrobium sp.]|jgi:uncharacterized protein (TIGR02118 family)|nr:EthD family reductase [Candidatus Deferrimicrobium sp.]
MINVAILYPATPASRFDTRFYVEQHMPLSIALLSTQPGYRGVSVEVGLGGAEPGTDPAYVAMCHYRFDSVDDFLAAFLPHADRLQADIANYTDIEPVIQYNEIAIADAPSEAGSAGAALR